MVTTAVPALIAEVRRSRDSHSVTNPADASSEGVETSSIRKALVASINNGSISSYSYTDAVEYLRSFQFDFDEPIAEDEAEEILASYL